MASDIMQLLPFGQGTMTNCLPEVNVTRQGSTIRHVTMTQGNTKEKYFMQTTFEHTELQTD